jgi:hypothetical protein
VAKERGAVLEEWRMSRDAAGRLQEAHWKLILEVGTWGVGCVWGGVDLDPDHHSCCALAPGAGGGRLGWGGADRPRLGIGPPAAGPKASRGPQGSKYADRLPIGLEKIIKTVPADVVKGFYQRWYRPQNLAVVAVGDFDVDRMVEVRAPPLALHTWVGVAGVLP